MHRRDEDWDGPSWPRRIAWLVALWVLGVLALGLVAGLVRLAMTAAGLTA